MEIPCSHPTYGAMILRVAILLLIPSVLSYKSGAPPSTCSDMIPQHHTSPQNSLSPYKVDFSPRKVQPGGKVIVTLASPPSKIFKGFFVQGRTEDNKILGSFVVDDVVNPVKCGDIEDSGATHYNNENKTILNLTWKSPNNYRGNVKFRTTFVENGSVFWVGVTPEDELSISGESLKEELIPDAPVPGEFEETKPFQWIYEGCYKTKGCFGGPAADCVRNKNCLQLVTYAYNNSNFDFELMGSTTGWLSVGFSLDHLMGSDLATVCARNQSNSRISVFQTWNEGKRNKVLPDMKLGLSEVYGKYEDNYIYCRYTSSPVITISNAESINFLNNTYYLFLAHGIMASATPPVALRKHRKQPIVSATMASVTSVEELGVASTALVKLHGCLMVIAWIGTVSVAIFLARYFKQTWTEVVHCKQKVWFTWHRGLNILTVLLTIIGFIVIFVQLNGWSQIWAVNPHPILGVVTTILAILQPIMAAFRCHPGTPKRPIFNWAHFLVGNGAHILAVITLFFAKPLSKAQLPDFYMWILIAFVTFHVIVFFIMEAFTCFKGKSIHSNQIAMKDMAANGNSYHINDPNTDAPGTRFRQFMLLLYSFGNICFIVALVATIASSPVKEQ
uniref:Ferric-chelate reductase 1 n=1 Tax=Scolopendra viridis TaxID=118503 RepID=A0A4D5R8W8_SCOVI